MSEKQKKGFVYGALVLSLSGFVCKLIGAVFRIPLTNLVGSAAMSYYSSAYSVYNVLLSLATSRRLSAFRFRFLFLSARC